MSQPKLFSFRMLLSHLGIPAIGLGGTFFAYGTQTYLAGFSLFEAFTATAIIYAVPGQLIVTDQAVIRAPLISVFLSVLLVNMRLMPMTMAVMPRIKSKSVMLNLVNAHFVALTTWLGFLRMEPELRHHPELNAGHVYFFYGFILWNIGWVMSLLGYVSGDLVSREIQLAFVYANPLYFLLLLLGQVQAKSRHHVIPILLGGALIPVTNAISPQWGIIIAGVVGGTVGYFLNRRSSKASEGAK